jgi:hypothetical protein
MMAKLQKRDAMIWSIRRMKGTGGCQSTQGETGPKVTLFTTNTIELAGN